MTDEITVLEVNKELLPYECNIVLGGELFNLHFGYNATAMLFTVDLYSKTGELLCAGEPIIYGIPLWNDVWNTGFPNVAIIPLDPSGESNAVTYDNLSDTVLLIITDREVE